MIDTTDVIYAINRHKGYQAKLQAIIKDLDPDHPMYEARLAFFNRLRQTTLLQTFDTLPGRHHGTGESMPPNGHGRSSHRTRQ